MCICAREGVGVFNVWVVGVNVCLARIVCVCCTHAGWLRGCVFMWAVVLLLTWCLFTVRFLLVVCCRLFLVDGWVLWKLCGLLCFRVVYCEVVWCLTWF